MRPSAALIQAMRTLRMFDRYVEIGHVPKTVWDALKSAYKLAEAEGITWSSGTDRMIVDDGVVTGDG